MKVSLSICCMCLYVYIHFGGLYVILKCCLPCVFETWFLTEPGTHLFGSFHWPASPRSLSPPPQHQNHKRVPPCLGVFLNVAFGSEIGSLKALYQLNYLSSPQISIFIACETTALLVSYGSTYFHQWDPLPDPDKFNSLL